MTSSNSNGPTTGLGLEDKAANKRKQSSEAIPQAWRLDEAFLKTLKRPLDKHKNNIMELNVPRNCGILSSHELSITEDFTVVQLLERLRTGQLTAEDVTVAFCKRAAVAQQLVDREYAPLMPLPQD